MQRQHYTPFLFAPERTTTHTEDIELTNMAELNHADVITESPEAPAEPASPTIPYCFAIHYALEPFLATADAVRESIDDADVYRNPQSFYERMANAGEYAQSVIAAPVAYGSAALMSVCGFFVGASHDIYHAATNCLTSDENDNQTNTNSLSS